MLAALSVADMLAQAWWVNMSLSIGFDPWWLGVLGIDGSSFDFLGFMAGVCAVLPVVGILLVLPAFIWPRERTLFHIMMLCFWEALRACWVPVWAERSSICVAYVTA